MKEERAQNWWQTLPGILTGLAGILTAASGLVIALQSKQVESKPEKTQELAGQENTPRQDPVKSSPDKDLFKDKATINDPDGNVIVRAGPGRKFGIVSRIREGETFYTIPKQKPWWRVRTANNEYGFVHRSQIKLQ